MGGRPREINRGGPGRRELPPGRINRGGGLRGEGVDLAENRSFSGSGRPRGPRDPLGSTGPAPHINLHKKSAPETNSKAIWRGY